MIDVRFDLTRSQDPTDVRLIARHKLLQVPRSGETILLHGLSYFVLSREWEIEETGEQSAILRLMRREPPLPDRT